MNKPRKTFMPNEYFDKPPALIARKPNKRVSSAARLLYFALSKPALQPEVRAVGSGRKNRPDRQDNMETANTETKTHAKDRATIANCTIDFDRRTVSSSVPLDLDAAHIVGECELVVALDDGDCIR